jgi:septal ring factor EnvC (AmiA/AmiB activator)
MPSRVRKTAARAALCALALGALLAFVSALPQASEAAGDAYRTRVNRYKQLKQQLQQKRQKLERIVEIESSTLGDLDAASRELNEVTQQLSRLRRATQQTKQRIDGLRRDVADLERRMRAHHEWMRRKLRAMQKYGGEGDTLMLLSTSADIGQFFRRWKYLEVLAENDRHVLTAYERTRKELAARQRELETAYRQAAAEEAELERTEQEMIRRKKKKEQILVAIRKERTAYERVILELNRSSIRMQKVISRAERAQAAPVVQARDFRQNKGKLPWPVEGRVAIPYGTSVDPEFQTPVFRNGIYLAASAGDVARAVFGGTVVYADWFEGYGQLVIVNHGGGYHTLYANLSEIFLRPGDIINSNGKVGLVGSSGMLEQPALYFEIRYKGKPLDPAQWLASR